MKKSIILLLLLLFCQLYARELRVLAIGNSFSLSVIKYLPPITASVPGCRIILTNTYIGGCSLKRHWNNICGVGSDAARTYTIDVLDSGDPAGRQHFRGKLPDLLKNNKYDIITIQQKSSDSVDYKTYQPYAANLISYIKKHQPQAEIIIQQTWSYRSDSHLLNKLKVNNSEMFERLSAAYARLAAENGFRVIPVGHAVQIFRAATPVKFTPLPTSRLRRFKYPAVPSSAGDVVGRHYWKKSTRTAKFILIGDKTHLNDQGEYLQAAVWFGFLFNKPATDIKYIPGGIEQKQAAFLLQCAQQALTTFKQPVAK